MAKGRTIGDEVLKIMRAYKQDIIDEETALQRIGEKFNQLGQNQSLVLQQESIHIGRIGTDLQAEQNTILKALVDVISGKKKP